MKVMNTQEYPANSSGKIQAIPLCPSPFLVLVAFGDAWGAVPASRAGLGSRVAGCDSLGIVLWARSILMFPLLSQA